MILTRTPYRVSLFGGGTDYPAWFKTNGGGAVLGMAIDQYCYVGVKRMPPGQVMESGEPIKFRVQYSKVDDCTKAEEIRHPAVRAALKYYALEDKALEFHCFGDMPGRAGLGGSSAFTVGLCHALSRLFQHSLGSRFDAWSLADDAIYIEQKVIPEVVGCQDQVFSAHGGLNLIKFSEQGREVHRLDLPSERLEELCYSLVLVFTGTMRDAHVMAAKQVKAIEEAKPLGNSQRFATLCRMRQQALDAHALLLGDGRIEDFGPMLDEAWRLKKSITPEISSERIDNLYDFGLKAGATGGKLLGAGGGGFVLFFVPVHRRDAFEETLIESGMSWVPFNISPEGTRAIVTED